MNKLKLNTTVKEVTDLLAKEAYEEIVKLSNGVRLTASEIKQAVSGYGQTISPLPEEGYKEIDVVEINDSKPMKWSVNVPVFTKEEGRSDLTLELTFTDTTSSLYKVEVDDLHVL